MESFSFTPRQVCASPVSRLTTFLHFYFLFYFSLCTTKKHHLGKQPFTPSVSSPAAAGRHSTLHTRATVPWKEKLLMLRYLTHSAQSYLLCNNIPQAIYSLSSNIFEIFVNLFFIIKHLHFANFLIKEKLSL